MPIDAAEPSDALQKQLETDAGPHATPDQVRAAKKRRDALAESEGRKSEPDQRHAPKAETAKKA